MNRIRFTELWDKLEQPRFTTIRSYRRDKETYYRSLVGQELLPWLDNGKSVYFGRPLGRATLRSVRVVKPGDLPAHELRADLLHGGQVDRVWESRVLAMDRALLLEFENHTELLAGVRP